MVLPVYRSKIEIIPPTALPVSKLKHDLSQGQQEVYVHSSIDYLQSSINILWSALNRTWGHNLFSCKMFRFYFLYYDFLRDCRIH